MEPNPSAVPDPRVVELDAALTRWRALILLTDLQRRAYLEQTATAPEPPGEGERLYRGLAQRLAVEVLQLRARLDDLTREDTPDAEDPPP